MKKDAYEIFAMNLKKYMAASGKNQKELAEVAGVSAPTFHDWIHGKKYPRIDRIEKLADYFGIEKSDLMEDKKSEDTIIENINTRLKTDPNFLETVISLYELKQDKMEDVNALLKMFLKK